MPGKLSILTVSQISGIDKDKVSISDSGEIKLKESLDFELKEIGLTFVQFQQWGILTWIKIYERLYR